MGERTEYAPGTFCWVELTTTDQDAAKAFYGELLGWAAEDRPVGEGGYVYSMMQVGGKNVGAIALQPEQQREAGVPPLWNSYVSVEDADATAARAGELGATVHAPPFDVMDVGRMAVIQDPQGAFFEIWQPREHFGASLVNAPGALVWNELASPDLEASSAFYGALFGWKVEPFEGSPEPVPLDQGRGGQQRRDARQPVASKPPPHFGSCTSGSRTSTRRLRGCSSQAGRQRTRRPGIDIQIAKIAIVERPAGRDLCALRGRARAVEHKAPRRGEFARRVPRERAIPSAAYVRLRR